MLLREKNEFVCPFVDLPGLESLQIHLMCCFVGEGEGIQVGEAARHRCTDVTRLAGHASDGRGAQQSCCDGVKFCSKINLKWFTCRDRSLDTPRHWHTYIHP